MLPIGNAICKRGLISPVFFRYQVFVGCIPGSRYGTCPQLAFVPCWYQIIDFLLRFDVAVRATVLTTCGFVSRLGAGHGSHAQTLEQAAWSEAVIIMYGLGIDFDAGSDRRT